MKRIILIFAMIISLSVVFGQTATLRLEMPATPPGVGEDFFVGVWLDELNWPTDETIWSAFYAWEFDDAILIPLAGGPPFFSYAHNINGMFTAYLVNVSTSNPNPGDVRAFFATGAAYGLDPSFYGGVPMKLFDLQFTYLGGDIAISWGTTAKLESVEGEINGGILAKAMTEMYAPPPPAVGVPYALELIPIPAEGNVTNWTGLSPTTDEWNDPLNWDVGGVPTGLPDQVVNVDATLKAGPPVIYGSAVAGILNLIAGTLSIAPGGSLTTTGLFTNSGTLYMSSDAAGVSASFVDQGGLAGAGTFQFDRDVFCSGAAGNSNNTFGWHYISSPIAGFTTDDIPDYYVNAWNEPATGIAPDYPWVHYAMDPIINPCTPWPQTPLNAMEAWSINFDPAYPDLVNCPGLPPGPGNIVPFAGPFTSLHQGLYTLPATALGGHTSVGYNFYGNPYASSIDPSLFSWAGFANAPTSVQEGVAIWSEDCTASNYIYSCLGNGYPFNVGPTQGFFLLTTGAANFSLTGAGVTDERVHDNGTTIFKDAVTNLLTLEAAGDGTSDLAYIRFMEGSEAGMDVADFPKLFSTSEGLAQIYTTALGEQLAVNALPATPVVPMGFTSVTSGEYTISAIETSDFADVVLEDLVTGEQTDLLINSYSFNYTVNDDADRFLVHFTPLGIGDNLANSIDIWSNDHKIYVQAPEINGDIVVFNMMGQEVIRTEIEPGLNIIPVNDRNSYYVVKVVSSDVARTGKVYVK